MDQPQYVGLLIKQYATGQTKWIKCLRTTAQHYGWLDAYDVIGETASTPSGVREFRYMSTSRWRPDMGGRRRRIGRGPRGEGNAAGQTNVFRISSKVTNADLAELARLTKGEWAWMETTCAQRWDREKWLGVA